MENQKKLGAAAFLPLIVFLALYVGCGITFTLTGVEDPFGQFPRHVALLAGVAVALLLAPKVKVSEKLDVFCQSMGNSGVMMIVLIYLMAGGFQGAAATMGGKDSVINMALHFIPVSLLIPGVFLMCCFISTAIGTSMGTIAAMAPVAIGVAQGAGLNPAIVGAAVIGGSYFGDNLSMISDTTISAAQGCGSEMRDKFRMNFFMALPAAIIAIVLYAILGGQGSGSIEAGAYSVIQVLPYIVVLVTALMGINVAVVLFIGILMTGIIGMAQGTVGFFEWVQGIGGGMSDMFSISIVAVLISASSAWSATTAVWSGWSLPPPPRSAAAAAPSMASACCPAFSLPHWSTTPSVSSSPAPSPRRSAASTASLPSAWPAWWISSPALSWL